MRSWSWNFYRGVFRGPTLLALFAVAGWGISSRAGLEIVNYETGALTQSFNYNWNFSVSATDLINSGQPTLLSVGGSFTDAMLNDGAHALTCDHMPSPGQQLHDTVFYLDASISGTGYDLLSLYLIFGRKIAVGGSGRDYEVWYSLKGSDRFRRLGQYAGGVTTGGGDPWQSTAWATDTWRDTVEGASLASGVDAVKIVWRSMGAAIDGIDVTGTPTQLTGVILLVR